MAQDLIILGGGLAGLTASRYTGAPVYEAADGPGGKAASDTVDGFTFDRGIHVLQTKDPRIEALFEEVGLDLRKHNRIAMIYAHRCYTPYPFQVNTTGLPLLTRAQCVMDFLRRESHPQPTNYEEWIRRSIGTKFATTFLIPYSEKFWTVHPREMTFEWTANRVPQPSRSQVIRGAIFSKQTKIGSNAVFRYPGGASGFGGLAEKLLDRRRPIHFGHKATRVDPRRRTVQFNGELEVPFKVLLSTIPLPDLIRIMTDAPDEVREAAGKLRANNILVVNLGIARPNISDAHWIHFPEKDISFFRISFPHNFSPDMVPPNMSSVSAEIAYSGAEAPDPEKAFRRVFEDLVRVGILRHDDRVVVSHTYDIKRAYCIYDMQRRSSLRTIKRWLQTVNIIPCGRYGLWAYFWSHEAVLSGRKAAQTALHRLRQLRAASEGSAGLEAAQ